MWRTPVPFFMRPGTHWQKNKVINVPTKAVVIVPPTSAQYRQPKRAITIVTTRVIACETIWITAIVPNPANPTCRIDFSVLQDGPATIDIYNITGKLVRRLLADDIQADHHSVIWDGADDMGRLLPSGTYLIRIRSGGVSDTKEALLVR